jgi:uracil-DNA glycosylase
MTERLMELLLAYQGPGTFNQYQDWDPTLDRPEAPALRCANLRRYLAAFADAAYVLVGEAAGYAGCRFSGIPFTGEAQLVGPDPLSWAAMNDDRQPPVALASFSQTSLGEPWRERSAEIVWPALNGRRDCVLWNAFPWHPHGNNPLTNRKPRVGELRQAAPVLRHFLSMFSHAKVFAVGRVSQSALLALDVSAAYIRHPSHGGNRAFAAAITSLPRRDLNPA